MTGRRNVATLYAMDRGLSSEVDLDGTANVELKVYQTTVMITVAAQSITLTLPSVAEAYGQLYSIFVNITNGGDVTVQDQDESYEWTDIALNADNEHVVLYSDGRRWCEFETGYS